MRKIFKNSLEQIQSSEEVSFSGPKWSLDLNKNFFGKSNNMFLICLLSSLIVYNMKKILRADIEKIEN